MMDEIINPLESDELSDTAETDRQIPAWLKVSAIAAASALVGGVAAAWFYRKAVSRLRNAELEPANTNFGISDWDEAE